MAVAVTTREGTTGLADRRGLSLRLPPRALPGGRSSKGNSRHTSWRAATMAKSENAHLAWSGRSLALGSEPRVPNATHLCSASGAKWRRAGAWGFGKLPFISWKGPSGH